MFENKMDDIFPNNCHFQYFNFPLNRILPRQRKLHLQNVRGTMLWSLDSPLPAAKKKEVRGLEKFALKLVTEFIRNSDLPSRVAGEELFRYFTPLRVRLCKTRKNVSQAGCSLFFNKTCLNGNVLPNYSNFQNGEMFWADSLVSEGMFTLILRNFPSFFFSNHPLVFYLRFCGQ